MGRKSKLSAEQWAEVERRAAAPGASLRSLAREFGIADSTLREHLQARQAEGPGESATAGAPPFAARPAPAPAAQPEEAPGVLSSAAGLADLATQAARRAARALEAARSALK